MLLSRTIHFNAGRSLWRPDWTSEKNRGVYGDEGPHGYGHNYELELSTQVVEQIVRPTGLIDPEVEVRQMTAFALAACSTSTGATTRPSGTNSSSGS